MSLYLAHEYLADSDPVIIPYKVLTIESYVYYHILVYSVLTYPVSANILRGSL